MAGALKARGVKPELAKSRACHGSRGLGRRGLAAKNLAIGKGAALSNGCGDRFWAAARMF